MATIPELLDGHVTLEVECLDRLYLNGYIGKLATGPGLVFFMREQLGKPIPSPVVLGQISEAFREAVKTLAEQEAIPVYQFRHKEKKDDLANEFRRQRPVRDAIVFIGVAQEKAQAYQGRKINGQFQFDRDKTVYVNHYYFYIDDAEFGPLFVKVCSYAPWSIKLCLNGHEWAKRQLEKRGIRYEALDNGFLSCSQPAKLQEICDSLGPEDIDRVFRKWLGRIPLPLRPQDRRAGYDWDLSIWQMEVSLTQIFDRPLRGREFFEEVIRDNLDLGRPDRVQLIFDRVVTKKTPGQFRTRVIQDGVHPSLHISYKNFDLKQYFKEGLSPATVGFLRIRNCEGCDIYIQPYADDQSAGYILLDLDSTGRNVFDRMRSNGHSPCVLLQTSPGHLQAWIHVSSSPLEPCIATAIARQLARDYGGDCASADWRHLGRLAGFTNQKPMRRTCYGHAPWVKVVHVMPGLAEGAAALLQSAKALVAGHAPRASATNMKLPTPAGISTSAAVEIYRGFMKRWRICERFPQPDWSIVDLWVARHLLANGMPATHIEDVLRLASPQFPRSHGDPQDYLRRTVERAAFPRQGGSVWDHHHGSASVPRKAVERLPVDRIFMDAAAARQPP